MASEWESCNSTKNILNQLVKTEFAKERLTAEFEEGVSYKQIGKWGYKQNESSLQCL